jgi:FKBP-type peptidyl-prolyl cis-trans isomerase 2
MALKDGDVVRFDYTLWVEGKLLETSEEAVARQQGIFREQRTYRPITVTLGASQIIKGLESHIRSHGQKGKAVKVEISPADGYGERDPKKIEHIPMAQFRQQKVNPEPGMQLNLRGGRGTVTRVGGGRVTVDLNHDLAGKALTYEYTLRDVLTDEKAKVNAVLENVFPKDSYKIDLGADALTLELPDQVKFDQSWMMAKFRIVADLRQATDKKKAIRLVENFPVMDETGLAPGHEGHAHGPEHTH